MARPHKPTALKILMGNPGKRPLPVDPGYPALNPIAPPDLLGEARTEWERLAPELISKGILTVADYSVFKDYCYAFGKVEELQMLILAEGMILENRNGDKQRHPALLARAGFQKDKEVARIQLGLTPVSRARVNPQAHEEAAEENPWAEEYER